MDVISSGYIRILTGIPRRVNSQNGKHAIASECLPLPRNLRFKYLRIYLFLKCINSTKFHRNNFCFWVVIAPKHIQLLVPSYRTELQNIG